MPDATIPRPTTAEELLAVMRQLPAAEQGRFLREVTAGVMDALLAVAAELQRRERQPEDAGLRASVVSLRAGGLSWGAIARTLGISVSAAKGYHSRETAARARWGRMLPAHPSRPE
jgi:DNA-binding NarL/FixJ family response regulator